MPQKKIAKSPRCKISDIQTFADKEMKYIRKRMPITHGDDSKVVINI